MWIVAVVVGVLWLLALAVGAGVFVLGSNEDPQAEAHTAEVGEPALISVPGYTYSDPDLTLDGVAEAFAEFEGGLATANRRVSKPFPQLGDLYLSWSTHEVLTDDTYLGLLFAVTINPEYASQGVISDDDILAANVNDLEAQGYTAQTETIAGQKVFIGNDDENWVAFWISDSTGPMVFFDNESQLRDFVATYIETANG